MRKICLIIFVLLFGFNSFAQEEVVKKKTYFGVRAGINFLKGSDQENQTSDLGVGYQIGGLVNIPFGKSNFSFQPEVLYLKINSHETTIENGYSYGQLTRLKDYATNIILIPLNFRYLIKNKVGIELGPSVGYRISGKTTETITFYDYTSGSSSSYTSNGKSTNTNSITGLLNFGIDYNITKKFNAGLKYYFAFGSSDVNNTIMNNSVFSFNLGYNFIK